MEIAELRADGHHVFQAAAGQRHLAAKALRHINNLLHTVHVGGKRRDDQPAVPSFCEKALKGFTHLPLAFCVARTLRIGGIGEQAEHALLPDLGKPGKVNHLAVNRRRINFKITRLDNGARLAADRQRNRIGNGMVHMDQFHIKSAERDVIPGLDYI